MAAKQFFSNIDFSGNAALNMVIGSLTEDPLNVANGYLYFNTSRNCLRVLSNGGWRDLTTTTDGGAIRVVESLPEQGEQNVIYLLLKETVSEGYNRYSMFVWNNGAYGQASGYSMKWSEIEDMPDLLDCSISANSSDYTLNLGYKKY